MIRIPLSTDITEIQSAFTDVDLALSEIRMLRAEVAALRNAAKTQSERPSAPSYVTQPTTIIEGDLRVTGNIDVRGDVDMPRELGGIIKAVPPGLSGYSLAQSRAVVNGSLSVLNGLSADTVVTRQIYVGGVLLNVP